ncbi:hypothetical protein MRX96_019361 [Rhipicephalus microplus]
MRELRDCRLYCVSSHPALGWEQRGGGAEASNAAALTAFRGLRHTDWAECYSAGLGRRLVLMLRRLASFSSSHRRCRATQRRQRLFQERLIYRIPGRRRRRRERAAPTRAEDEHPVQCAVSKHAIQPAVAICAVLRRGAATGASVHERCFEMGLKWPLFTTPLFDSS